MVNPQKVAQDLPTLCHWPLEQKLLIASTTGILGTISTIEMLNGGQHELETSWGNLTQSFQTGPSSTWSLLLFLSDAFASAGRTPKAGNEAVQAAGVLQPVRRFPWVKLCQSLR